MMKRVTLLLCLIPGVAVAQVSGQWVMITDLWGHPAYRTLTLVKDGEVLTGDVDGDKITGRITGSAIAFQDVDANNATYSFNGTIEGGRINGIADFPDTTNPAMRARHAFTARRIPERPAGPPRRHVFEPTDFSYEFSPHRLPVLTVWPGDSVQTKTIDSGGADENGRTQALFGNPQTGPFFIAGASPGDTLVVRIKRLRPNRDYAESLDAIVDRAVGSRLAAKAGELGEPVRWTLDRQRQSARLQAPTENLREFSIALRPMLGGLAVAPGFGWAPISTGDSGRFGGNMDFNEVVEGNTVYLPVQQPGALLYLGDAHAAQGDGETSQYALETSMDVELSVDLIKGKAIQMPRVESPTELMALGQAGSLDDALRAASDGLLQWLQLDYGYSLSECAIILGSSAHYSIATLAGRNVSVAARIDKSLLRPRLDSTSNR